MKILGLQKQSLIEYPGKISAVIFLGGCNFRCPFCHVPTLVLPELIETQNEISQEEILSFLEKRKSFLEAVSITGGEPTLNKDLPDFIKKIKSLGFLVQLETNGTNPEMLRKLIEEKLIDYAAMDIKHRLDSFEKYNEITGFKLTKELFKNIKESIKILLSNKIDYQFRTTLIKEFHKKEDILEICKEIQGVRVYYLQNYQKENKTISGNIFTPFREEEIEEIIKDCKNLVNIHYRKYL
jgi:pyruvate formate lyase activating enzyme